MKCLKCGCENFILESTIAITEKYKIYKNGRVSEHPMFKEDVGINMADNDNIIRCTKCHVGYVIPYQGRTKLLYKIDFSKFDLEKDAIVTEY